MYNSYETVFRACEKRYGKISKTLVYYRAWRRNGTHPLARFIMEHRVPNMQALAIWIYVYRAVCKRKDGVLHNEVYDEAERIRQAFRWQSTMFKEYRTRLHLTKRRFKQQIPRKRGNTGNIPPKERAKSESTTVLPTESVQRKGAGDAMDREARTGIPLHHG